MNRILTLVLVLITCYRSAAAITISGRIESAATCGPAAGLRILIRDSTETVGAMSWKDSTVTDASGRYSFTIPGTVPGSKNYLVLSFTNCAYQARVQIPYTAVRGDIVENHVICGAYNTLSPAPEFNYSGPLSSHGDMVAYLIDKHYDSAIGDTVLTAIDSLFHTDQENRSFIKGCIPQGRLLVKLVPLPAHPLFAAYLPTYSGAALRWNGAVELDPADWASGYLPINMIAGKNTGGPGFVGGSVRVGANKTTGTGDPLAGKPIILTTDNGDPVAAAYSDATGQYGFSGLPLGNYMLSGDVFGKANPAVGITLTAAAPHIGNLNFLENQQSFRAAATTLGVQHAAGAGIGIFPNPASDYLYVTGLGPLSGPKQLILYAVTGAAIRRESVGDGAGRAAISIADLPAGSYFLRVTTPERTFTFAIRK